MAKHIERETLISELSASCIPIDDNKISGLLGCGESIRDIINAMPAADVRPERYSHWTERADGCFECSTCGYSYEHEGYAHFFRYCPCCGAKIKQKGG